MDDFFKPVWRVPGKIVSEKLFSCCLFSPSISVSFHLFYAFCFWSSMFSQYNLCLCLAFWAILHFLNDAFWSFRLIKWLVWPNSSFKDNPHPASLGCFHLRLHHSCRKQVTLPLISFSPWIILPNSVSDAACLTFLIYLGHCVSCDSCHSIFHVLSKSNIEEFFFWLYSLLC